MEAFVRLHQPTNLPSQQTDASPAPAVQRQTGLVPLDPAWPHQTIAHSNAEENLQMSRDNNAFNRSDHQILDSFALEIFTRKRLYLAKQVQETLD